MKTFESWINQFQDEVGFLSTLSFDISDDYSFPIESNSFEEISNYIRLNWNTNDHYFKQLRNAFDLYEKEKEVIQ